jgi:hypothetical protein
MPKLKAVHIKLSDRQIRELAKIGADTGLDRSSLIRLSVAHFIEDEKQRKKSPRYLLPPEDGK